MSQPKISLNMEEPEDVINFDGTPAVNPTVISTATNNKPDGK